MADPLEVQQAAELARTSAMEAIVVAQELLSTTMLMELQRLSDVAPRTKATVAAAMCLLAGTVEDASQFEASGVPLAAWGDLTALLGKPGSFLAALRRFPSVVDSGQLPKWNVWCARRCLDAPPASTANATLSESEQLVSLLDAWVQASLQYCEASGFEDSGLEGTPLVPATSASLAQSPYHQQVRAAAAELPGTRTSTSSRPLPRSANVHAAPKPKAAVQRPAALASGYKAARPIPAPVRASTAVASPNATPLAATLQPAALRPHGKPVAAKTTLRTAGMTLEEMKTQFEHLKKQTREMKVAEANLKFQMAREETAQKVAEKKEDAETLYNWRLEERNNTLRHEDKQRQLTLEKDILENKEFQEFKREVKAGDRQNTIQINHQNYLDQKENSEWFAEHRRNNLMEQQKLVVEEHLEQRNFMVEHHLQELLREESDQKQDRLESDRREMELQLKQAAQQKALALESLEYIRSHQHSAVPGFQHLPTHH